MTVHHAAILASVLLLGLHIGIHFLRPPLERLSAMPAMEDKA